MNREQKVLLKLIIAALFGTQSKVMDDVDWGAVQKEAEAQTVTCLVASMVPPSVAEKWKNATLKSEASFLRILHGQSQMVQLLEDAAIPFVILKGTSAAMYYPFPCHRMMGDVDLLVPHNCFEQVARLMGANGYRALDDLERQLNAPIRPRHIEFVRDGVKYELHHHFSKDTIKIEDYLIKGLAHAERGCVYKLSFPVLPAMENGLLLLAHAAIHLSSSELGLRQVIDWMMFVYQKLDDEKWKDCFCEMAEQAGLRELAVALTRLCRDHLGLPGEYRWCEEADEKVVSDLLNLIFERGNFGRKVPNHYNLERITAKAKARGLFTFLKQIGGEVWNGQNVQSNKKVLRPFVFIKEFSTLFNNRVRASKGHIIKDLKSGNELSKLYKALGLNTRS